MAAIALDRLWQKLSQIDRMGEAMKSADLAEAVLDAWSIVDASHRLVDLVKRLPGLPNASWRRIFRHRMADALALRDTWQHQDGEVEKTVERRGQAWGSLAWAQHDGQRPTGRWYLAVAGTEFKGSSWLHAGPSAAIPREDTRRIRLLHAEKSFYLARAVRDIFEMIGFLEEAIRTDRLRLVGEAVNRQRSNDTLSFSIIEVVYTLSPSPSELPASEASSSAPDSDALEGENPPPTPGTSV